MFLDYWARDASFGFARIILGENPDGSGDPLGGDADGGVFFKLGGRPENQFGRGGTGDGGSLRLSSTASGVKGSIYFGEAGVSAYDEANQRLGIGTASPSATLHVLGSSANAIKLRPSGASLDAATPWRGQDGGTNLGSYLDEQTRDDNDYIFVRVDGVDPGIGQVSAQLALPTPTSTPSASNTHTLRVAYRRTGSGGVGAPTGPGIDIALYKNGVVVTGSWISVAEPAPGGFVAATVTLSAAQITALGDYSGLSLWVNWTGSTSGVVAGSEMQVSWLELDCGAATSTTPLTRWSDSDGTVFLDINADGHIAGTSSRSVVVESGFQTSDTLSHLLVTDSDDNNMLAVQWRVTAPSFPRLLLGYTGSDSIWQSGTTSAFLYGPLSAGGKRTYLGLGDNLNASLNTDTAGVALLSLQERASGSATTSFFTDLVGGVKWAVAGPSAADHLVIGDSVGSNTVLERFALKSALSLITNEPDDQLLLIPAALWHVKNAGAVGTIVGIDQGVLGQTGALREWRASTGARLGFISAAGMVEIEAADGQFIIPSSGTLPGFAARPQAGGTPLRLLAKDTSDNVYVAASAGIPSVLLNPAGVVALRATTNAGTGRVRIGDASFPGATLDIAAPADEITLKVTAFSGGTTNFVDLVAPGGSSSLVIGSSERVEVNGLRIWPNAIGFDFYTDLNGSPGLTANRTITFPNSTGVVLVSATQVNITGRTTSVVATTIITSAAIGVWQVNAYMHCSTAGDAGDSVQLSVYWTDDTGVEKSAPLTTLSLTAATTYANATFSFRVGSGNIRYSTALSSPGAGTPAHSIRLRLTFLG